MRVLHVAAELFPLVKVGGLADVMAALPAAQRALGADARLLLPGFPALLQGLQDLEPLGEMPGLPGAGPVRLLLGRSASGVPVYLLDCPSLFDRPGGPYEERGDSHLKFGTLGRAAARVAQDGDLRGWRPEVVQAHDWQAGLTPVHLALAAGPRPRTITTIHNLAYQGIYPRSLLGALELPLSSFHLGGVEFYGQINFLKARPGLRGPDHHREPHLRRGDPAPGPGRGPGRAAGPPDPGPDGDPQRRGLPGVEPRHQPAPVLPLRPPAPGRPQDQQEPAAAGGGPGGGARRSRCSP